MKKLPRIPRTYAEYDLYLKRVEAWLKIVPQNQTLSNGERLGMSSAEIIATTAFLTICYTGNPSSPGVYEIHTNPNAPKNTQQVKNAMKNFIAFFQPILVRMSGSAHITVEDRRMLNIAEPVEHHSKKSKALETQTSVSSIAEGSANVKVICTPIESETSGIAPGANAVELAFCIIDPTLETDFDEAGKVRKTPPANVDEVFYREIHTKSINLLTFDQKYRGKQVYVYARQYIVEYPELAGPWSEVHIFFIP
ncbi:MAG: hypothetical protein WCH34_04030 [Bacteroidota bacterium]